MLNDNIYADLVVECVNMNNTKFAAEILVLSHSFRSMPLKGKTVSVLHSYKVNNAFKRNYVKFDEH